jgi:hypothetical protein
MVGSDNMITIYTSQLKTLLHVGINLVNGGIQLLKLILTPKIIKEDLL